MSTQFRILTFKLVAIVSKPEGADSELALVCTHKIAISNSKLGQFAKSATIYNNLHAKGEPFSESALETKNAEEQFQKAMADAAR